VTGDGWLPDDLLDSETREALAAFTTPRRGTDGGWCWPAAEVRGIVLPEPFPPEWEAEVARRDEQECDAEEPAPADPLPLERLIAAEVRRRQSARRLRRTSTAATMIRPSRWAHVPLAQLFAAAGNCLYERGNGTIECAHEPLHSSKGGRCVSINPTTGLWWCRGCRRGGDAATFLIDLTGCSTTAAAAQLTQAYGPPAAGQDVSRRRGTARTSRRRLTPVIILAGTSKDAPAGPPAGPA
jgi:hypothetical protein